jgi:hypothetical protein
MHSPGCVAAWPVIIALSCCHAMHMHARVADSELMMDGRVLCRFVGRDLIEWLGSTEPYHRRMHNHRVMHAPALMEIVRFVLDGRCGSDATFYLPTAAAVSPANVHSR